jgi:frataxin-like iron-binding protein CyaY
MSATMTRKQIQANLEKALLHNGIMQHRLYEYELEELMDELFESLARDHDHYLFAVTENSNDVAMVLIEASGQVYINEQARERLQQLWPATYAQNMRRFIPTLAKQLHQGHIPINGVKVVKQP